MSKKIYANDLIPGSTLHPGCTIKEELEAIGITQNTLAERMGVAKNVVSDLINGRRNITVDIAIKLENALEISAILWMGLQSQHEIALARINSGKLTKSRRHKKENVQSDKSTLIASTPSKRRVVVHVNLKERTKDNAPTKKSAVPTLKKLNSSPKGTILVKRSPSSVKPKIAEVIRKKKGN